jgi:hypothetical protein
MKAAGLTAPWKGDMKVDDERRYAQLFYPGMPERTEPWTGDYEIVWSIYIRCNNRQKLRRVHIPALEAIIGQPHGGRGWVIEKENNNPEELRLMATEILAGSYSDAMLLSLLRKLYALKPHWHLAARLNAEHPRGVYVMATYSESEPSSAVPAVSNVMVELQPDFSRLIDGSASQRERQSVLMTSSGEARWMDASYHSPT